MIGARIHQPLRFVSCKRLHADGDRWNQGVPKQEEQQERTVDPSSIMPLIPRMLSIIEATM